MDQIENPLWQSRKWNRRIWQECETGQLWKTPGGKRGTAQKQSPSRHALNQICSRAGRESIGAFQAPCFHAFLGDQK
jgi:hypothetical protein